MKKSVMMTTVAAAFAMATTAEAANFSYQGNLSGPDAVQSFTFVVGSTSNNVILRTWSYAGGVNAAGDVIARGGFDPILAVFSGTGSGALLIAQNDDGGSDVPADSVSNRNYDTYLDLSSFSLAPGTYTVSVSQYDAFATGPTFGDGFGDSLNGNYVDASGSRRDSHWAFDILNVEQATVVTPDGGSTLLLMSLATGACVLFTRKNRKA